MLRRRNPSLVRIAALAVIVATLSLALPASAVSATRTYVAVNVHCDIATFKLVGLKPATVRAARVTFRQRDARVAPAVVRRGARRGMLRLRLSTLRWTATRTQTHKRRTANRRRAERHAERARREKHTGCRHTRAQQAQVRRRKRPKLTVIISDPPTSTDPVAPPSAEEPSPLAGMGYTVKFEDQFDTLGSTNWGAGIWYAPSQPADAAYVSNGVLELVSRRSQGYPDVTVTTEAGANAHHWQYGYFEARMKWSKGNGAWPAFWLYSYQHAIDQNQCTTQAGEVDVFEGQGSEPDVFYGTVHSNTNGCSPADQQNGNNYQPQGVDLTQGFHTYGALWTPTSVTWYLDGRLVMSAPTYATDNQQMFVLFQMWIGGWTNGTDATTPDELKTEVDWVKVWQK